MMCERAGTSKAGGWTDYASLEIALRDDLDAEGAARDGGARSGAPRCSPTGPRSSATRAHREAVHGAGPSAPARARRARASRSAPSSGSSATTSPRCRRKGFFRLFPGNRVRLKYGYVVECTGCEKDAQRQRHARARDGRRRHEERHAGRRRGEGQGHASPGSAVDDALPAEVRLYDRLFIDAASRRRRQGLQGEPEPGAASSVVAGYRRALARRRAAPATASSSSATATSSPTGSTTPPAGRCSTAPRRCATPGRS